MGTEKKVDLRAALIKELPFLVCVAAGVLMSIFVTHNADPFIFGVIIGVFTR